MSSSQSLGVEEMEVLRRQRRNVFDGMAEHLETNTFDVLDTVPEDGPPEFTAISTGVPTAITVGSATEAPVPVLFSSVTTTANDVSLANV